MLSFGRCRQLCVRLTAKDVLPALIRVATANLRMVEQATCPSNPRIVRDAYVNVRVDSAHGLEELWFFTDVNAKLRKLMQAYSDFLHVVRWNLLNYKERRLLGAQAPCGLGMEDNDVIVCGHQDDLFYMTSRVQLNPRSSRTSRLENPCNACNASHNSVPWRQSPHESIAFSQALVSLPMPNDRCLRNCLYNSTNHQCSTQHGSSIVCNTGPLLAHRLYSPWQ